MIQTLINRGANVNARIAEVPPIRRWILPISDISWVDFTGQTPFLRAARGRSHGNAFAARSRR
jgi:hypothetical protein